MYLQLPQNQDAKPAELEGKGREGNDSIGTICTLVPVYQSITMSPGP